MICCLKNYRGLILKLDKNNSKNMKFEFFDVTADVGYRAYGKTLGSI